MPGKARPKAESKAQQKVAGMAHAIQKGEITAKPGTPSAEMAKSMGKADTKSMASTKHKGLPEHAGGKRHAAPKVHMVDSEVKMMPFPKRKKD